MNSRSVEFKFEKRCSKCEVAKPITEFTKREKGRRASHCKLCKSHFIRTANYYDKNKRYIRNIKYEKSRPAHVTARKLVNRLIKRGELVRGSCVICGQSKTEGHHSDYSKPTEVLWLCIPHHNAWHRVFVPEGR